MKTYWLIFACFIIISFKQEEKVTAIVYKSKSSQLVLYDPLDKEILKKRPILNHEFKFVLFKSNPTIQMWDMSNATKPTLASQFTIKVIDAEGFLVCEHISSGGVHSNATLKINTESKNKEIVIDWTDISQKSYYVIDEISHIKK